MTAPLLWAKLVGQCRSLGPAMFSLENRTLALTATLLLCVWLLLRVRGKEERPRRPRHTPLSAAELTRMIVSAVRADDVRTLRELYLLGHEVRDVVGQEKAARYLEALPVRLVADIAQLRTAISSRATLAGTRELPDGSLWVDLAEPGCEPHAVYLGRAMRIGPVWRLVDPPGGPVV